MNLNVLLIGASGLLGTDVAEAARVRGWTLETPGRDDLDLADERSVLAYFLNCDADWILNCAAYTNVDGAETDLDAANMLNAAAPFSLARQARRLGSRFLQMSTDYVFDGKRGEPYTENDPTDPVNSYGKSKLQGEELVREEDPNALIVRSSWLFGNGGRCFPKSIIMAAKKGNPLRVVDDQKGSPTYTRDLAEALIRLVEISAPGGVYHVVNSGEATWFEFAKECIEAAGIKVAITLIKTEDWPTAAPRPLNTVLDTTKFRSLGLDALPDWKDAVTRFVDQLDLDALP
ncbi:MAG: dTDP-4-dehydrorhamnose reductase [Armatimonadetes bacterium]|nr:dTDP-4-dehydrorhamnose reductase [Armatimonadota bacterium]